MRSDFAGYQDACSRDGQASASGATAVGQQWIASAMVGSWLAEQR
jgi:hypothetical protein